MTRCCMPLAINVKWLCNGLKDVLIWHVSVSINSATYVSKYGVSNIYVCLTTKDW